MEEDDANSAKDNFSDSDGSGTAKPGKEDVISTGIEKLNITDHQEERRGKSVAEQPIQEEGYDGDEDEDVISTGIEKLNITDHQEERRGKSVAEQPIQEEGYDGDEDEDGLTQQQQEMATPPSSPSLSSSSLSSSSCSSPQTTLVHERKRKSMAEQPIQEDDSDHEMTDVEDLDMGLPFLAWNKRNCRRKLLFQEDDHSIGLESKIETTKKTQLSISSSHCALGDNAPASAATDLADDQDSDNQVEEDQDQESTRNTANPQAKSRLPKMGPSEPTAD